MKYADPDFYHPEVLAPATSRRLRTRFWYGARHRFIRSMFQTPTSDPRHAQRWVRQVHAWFQEVVVKCST